MKIYLLRHEIRDLKNPLFYSPLLQNGLKGAQNLKKILKKNNINLIFASPFKRVLQTIKPYCDSENININIEYSLYEQIFEHNNVDFNFDRENFRKKLKKTDDEYYLINSDYKSFLPLSEIMFTENTENRAYNFLMHIIQKYKNTDENILFASHEGILLQMIGLYNKSNIPMGGLLLCYDNGNFTIENIN